MRAQVQTSRKPIVHATHQSKVSSPHHFVLGAEGAETVQLGLQMGLNHIYKHLKWSRVAFRKGHMGPNFDPLWWAQAKTPQNAAKGAPGAQTRQRCI